MLATARGASSDGDGRVAEVGVFRQVARATSNSTPTELARSSEADVRPTEDSDSVDMRAIASIPLENTSMTLGTAWRLKIGNTDESDVGEGGKIGSASLNREGREGKKENSDAGTRCVV